MRCGIEVVAVTNGSYRNHCPACLWSRHLDVVPGDRAARCGAPMQPERIDHRSGKGLVIVHRCTGCGACRVNRIAADTVQADDVEVIATLAAGRRR